MIELACGDSLNILKNYKSYSFDLAVVDPPYSAAFVGKLYDKLKEYQGNRASLNKDRNCNSWSWGGIPGYWTANFYKTNDEYEEFTLAWMKEVERLLQFGSFLLCFGSHKLINVNIDLALKAGFDYRDLIIWNYGHGFSRGLAPKEHKNLRTVLANSYETILVFQKKSPVNYPQTFLKYGTGFVDTEILKSNIIEIKKPSKKEKLNNPHYSVKPEKLIELLILAFRGRNILDPFMGSGTTGVVCKKLGLNYLGIELEQSFYDYSVERIGN